MPIDAWLANWDAIGTGKDNIIVREDGTPFRIDMGGSLLYRAQGTPKGDKFGYEVPELKTFIDANLNKDAADIFGGVDRQIMTDAVKRLEQIDNTQIAELVNQWGPRDQDAKMHLYDTLVARKEAVIDEMSISQLSNEMNTTSIQRLPNEMITNIMLNMDIKELYQYCQTSNETIKLCSSKVFWDQKFKQDGLNVVAEDKNYASDIMMLVNKINKHDVIEIRLQNIDYEIIEKLLLNRNLNDEMIPIDIYIYVDISDMDNGVYVGYSKYYKDRDTIKVRDSINFNQWTDALIEILYQSLAVSPKINIEYLTRGSESIVDIRNV